MRRASLVFICSLLVSACNSDSVHKDLVDFDGYEWAAADVKSFDFEIEDNSRIFQVNYLLRNALQYPFSNIYLKSALKDSSGNVLVQGMEVLVLFDEKTGKPKGDGLGDLFDHRIGAAQYKDLKFPYNGKYSFEIQQSMRPDPLVGIMSIGFEILEPKK